MLPKKRPKLDADVLDESTDEELKIDETSSTDLCYENINDKYKTGVKFTLDEIVYVTLDLICPHSEKNPKDLFYIGEQIITGVYFEGRMPLLSEINIVICRDNLEDVGFYMSVMSNIDVTINKPIRIELQCEIFRVLMKLIAESYFKLVLKSVEENEKFNFSFTCDVYLTQKLKKESLNAYPAVSYQNKHAKDINFLISSFCFQEKNRLESSSTKLNQTIDNHIYSESSDAFKNAHDSLFKLIHSLNNKNNVKSDMEIDLIQEKSCLIPLLRPYQIDAVKWMLRKENFDFTRLDSNWEIIDKDNNKETEIHCLYTRIENKYSDVIYFHKYLGFYTCDIPLKAKSILGGVLADEMGLGKTLEILACIQINQRMDYELKDDATFKLESKEKCNKSNLFECVCGEEPHLFYMVINKSPLEEEYDLYQCNICHVWLHSKCVNFHGSREEFVCLNCQMDSPAVPSKCTLIITPFIISHQWIEEINKRLNKKLNILFYQGAKKGYIQPRDLADLDLCLTTYDVLNAELAHTYATENSRTMRNRKRFALVPSSLLHVEWWRICLDEAQMVHSTNSKCADMANRLQAVNRWCISGTPIGKSIADLHGLFAFIREDPYCEKRWFDELLFRPFKNKDQMTMAKEVSKVLWRNTKQFVGDQIQIPPQTEHVYWLNFSPFEVHLYECVREQFKERLALGFKDPSVNRAIKDYKGILDYNPHLRLEELDRQTINTLLAPILNLRLLCNHPQLILRRNDFMNQHGRNVDATDKFLTMEKSLELITKKTRVEAENTYRAVATSSNALAGIKIIQEQYRDAIDIYQTLLDSEKDKIPHEIRLDKLLLIHTCFNYIETINLLNKDETNKICFDEKIHFLNKKLSENEKIYVLDYDEIKIKSELKIREKLDENKFLNSTESYLSTTLSWLSKVIDTITNSNLFEEFWQKITSEFMVRKEKLDYKMSKNLNSEFELRIYNQSIISIQEMKAILLEEFEKILIQREKTFDELLIFFEKEEKMKIKGKTFKNEDMWYNGITKDLVQQIAQCHLRPESFTDNKEATRKCRLCQAKASFKAYSDHFNLKPNDDMINLNNRRRYQKLDNEELIRSIFNHEYGEFSVYGEITKPSDLEKILKHVTWFLKHDPSYKQDSNLVPVADSTQELMSQFSYLKDEQKTLSRYIETLSYQINAYDEIEIAKIRMRLATSFEQEVPDFESLHIIKPHMLNSIYLKNEEEKCESEKRLRKKLNQIIYLKNLEKTYEMKDGEENSDSCPICNEPLGFEWIILSCGHLFCSRCNTRLMRLSEKMGHIRCAMCREMCLSRDSYLVSTVARKEPITTAIITKSTPSNSDKVEPLIEGEQVFSDIRINGSCNSAKVEGVVKCLVKIIKNNTKAKCVVFSEHFVILDLIISLLHENAISYCCVRGLKGSSQNSVDAFKNENNFINVLLMLYSHGANGLNLIEATHVLLVEPTLNKSQEMQAIGRVHRIGQTKPTHVHRFIIRHTIEEQVYKIFNSNQILDLSKPMTSKASLDDASFDSNQSEKKNVFLTVGDIHSLFKNL